MNTRHDFALAVAAALLVAISITLAGCGNPIIAAKRTLTSAAQVIKAADDAWKVADDAKQRQIIEDSGTLDIAQANLKAWRDQVQPKVGKAIATASGALLAAHRALAFAEAGIAGKADLMSILKSLWDQLTELRAVLERYEVNLSLGGL